MCTSGIGGDVSSLAPRSFAVTGSEKTSAIDSFLGGVGGPRIVDELLATLRLVRILLMCADPDGTLWPPEPDDVLGATAVNRG